MRGNRVRFEEKGEYDSEGKERVREREREREGVEESERK